MVPLFYVEDSLIFSSYKDKNDELYDSIQVDSSIEDDVDLNKCIGIEMKRRPDGSIHLMQPYLTQGILNMIPGMDKSSANPTPVVKPPLVKR